MGFPFFAVVSYLLSYSAFHGAWGIGHGAWSMEHGAWSIGHGA